MRKNEDGDLEQEPLRVPIVIVERRDYTRTTRY